MMIIADFGQRQRQFITQRIKRTETSNGSSLVSQLEALLEYIGLFQAFHAASLSDKAQKQWVD